MPNPTSSTTVQRPDLGALAWEYLIDAPSRGFIGLQVMPSFGVPEKSMDYPKIPIESLLKLKDTKRGARSAYARDDYEFETGTFNCQEYGLESPVSDVEARLYRRFFDAEEVASQIVMDHILRDHEARVAAALFSTANAVGNAGVTVEWSTPATCTPKADVKAGIQAMRAASGLEPNAIVMSKKVMENVLVSAELKTYLQYTSPHLMETMEAQKRALATYFSVDQVIVGGAIKDGAKKGQSFSGVDLWDDEYVSLCRVSSGGPNLREPVFGRTFLWEEDAPEEVVMESYREEQTRSEIIRGRQHVDEAVIFTGANYLLTNITA